MSSKSWSLVQVNPLSSCGWCAGTHPMVPTLVAVPGKSKQRFMMLPPPPDRADPLSIVDLGKAAEVLYRHSSCCCWTVLWSHNLSKYTQSCIHLEQLRFVLYRRCPAG